MESGMQGKEKDRGGKKEKEGSGVETRMKDGEKEKGAPSPCGTSMEPLVCPGTSAAPLGKVGSLRSVGLLSMPMTNRVSSESGKHLVDL
ncbi:hypothetical protein Y1Q_0002990 [Alligator mississippiensis]|uniref:Uncharacterized protein n=1 Tax=Alligator mississippiensis TaxID=8496 RepID=A0A151MCZ7_ALLMI|nr:hypothetical protein Y1Q_0002990 [Alligator mississippiensis]